MTPLASLPFPYRLALLDPHELRAAVLYADGLAHGEVCRALGTKSGGATQARILDKLSIDHRSWLRYYRAELRARAGVII